METAETFVNSLILASTEGREPMTEEEAAQNLREWKAEGWEDIPEELDAATLAALWNEGIKEEAKREDITMKHGLTFDWIGGNTTAADHMIKTFKAAGIPWRYGSAFNLQADLDGSGFASVEYYRIAGDTFGITKLPPRTSEYFGIPAQELYRDKPDADGYFPEELKALDATEEPGRILAGSLLEALEMADYHRRAGYETVDIVESLQHYGSYFVLCRNYNPACRAC